LFRSSRNCCANKVERARLAIGADMDDACKSGQTTCIAEQEDMDGAQIIAETACDLAVTTHRKNRAAHQSAVQYPPGQDCSRRQHQKVEWHGDGGAGCRFKLEQWEATESTHCRRQGHDPDRADESQQEATEEILRADGDDQ